MFKKLLLTSILATLSSGFVFAGNLYYGPSLALTDVAATGSNFRGLTPRLVFGYRGLLGPDIFLGGEVYGALVTLPFAETHQPTSASARITRDLGLALLPGVMVSNEVEVFLRFGVTSTQFSTARKTVSGGQVGVGLETILSKHFNFRGEYAYTQYQHINNLGKPTSDNYIFSVIYTVE